MKEEEKGMIYTLTCNPSLDYMMQVSNFQMGKTNRASWEKMFVGGKGINVSLMLKNLGYNSTCLGFVAGFTGEEIMRQTVKLGLGANFIVLREGMSRVNVKLSSFQANEPNVLCETEVNGIGPNIDGASLDELRKNIAAIEDGDFIILSGSIPKSLTDTLYESIMEQLEEKDVKIVVDATGNLLRNSLKKSPFLVKPNKQELEELYKITIHHKEQLIECGKMLQAEGAKNVLISLGGDGALLLTEKGNIYSAKTPDGELINAVGAGDSMVAGFLTGYIELGEYEHAFRMSVAAGSASAFSEGFARREMVEMLMSQIQIQVEKF